VLASRELESLPRRPLATYALIAVNVALFAYQSTLALDDVRLLTYRYGVVPYMLAREPHLASFATPFTSMFLHGGSIHLLFNLAFLYAFGGNVERALGLLRYVAFYLVAGLCAVLAHVLVEPDSHVPMVGASGAIAGVLGAYLRLYPQAGAAFFIAVWFLLQLLHGLGTLGIEQQSGSVAFFAHIGGFVAGLWLVGLFGLRSQPRQSESAKG
jgi:membrane associated rhomboid family serine protease